MCSVYVLCYLCDLLFVCSALCVLCSLCALLSVCSVPCVLCSMYALLYVVSDLCALCVFSALYISVCALLPGSPCSLCSPWSIHPPALSTRPARLSHHSVFCRHQSCLSPNEVFSQSQFITAAQQSDGC